MKIGILLHDFALGGVERVALRLARAWQAQGHTVLLLTGSTEGPLAGIVPAGMEQRMFPGAPDPRRKIGALAQRAASVARPDIDALFVPGNTYLPPLPALRRAWGKDLRIVAKVSNVLVRPDRSALRNRLFGMATGWRLGHADAVVAMSESLRAECAALPFLRKAAVTAIDEPTLDVLPEARDEAMPDATKAHRDPQRLCFVGRLEPQKDPARLLHALALLGDPAVRLDIVGDGSQRAELEALTGQLGIASQVQFHGFQPDPRGWLAAAHAMVLPSAYEGYPAVLVEAAAAGTFVVTTACSPAIAEIVVPGRTGLVVDAPGAGPLAAAIRTALASEGDAVAMRALAGRHLIEPVARRYAAVLAGP